jgi:uncharacterized protein YndB with AHSA1/START domain
MARERFELEARIPAAPGAVYRAWLTGKEHARMTGGPATGEPAVGADHSAWDGYIRGRNLALEPEARIVQSWRTTEFPESAPDSILEVRLFGDGGGTRLVLVHSDIPEGQGAMYREGWVEHYFEPMQKHFGTKQAPAKKPAAKKAKATASSRGAAAGARGRGRTKKASPRRRK